jgi:hypothetical protein
LPSERENILFKKPGMKKRRGTFVPHPGLFQQPKQQQQQEENQLFHFSHS